MVTSRSAYGCTNRFKKESNIYFHKFPDNASLKKTQIPVLKRKDFLSSKRSVICSQHFKPSDFVCSPDDFKPRLKSDSVPSIFNFPKHLQKPVKSNRKPPKKRNYRALIIEKTGPSHQNQQQELTVKQS